MEDFKTDEQFDPQGIGEHLRESIEAAEAVLDEVTGNVEKMRGALVKLGFTARTERETDAHFAEMTTKLAQVSAQAAVLYGLLAFEKAMLGMAVSLPVMCSAYSALIDTMVQTATGLKPRLQ